MRISGLGCRVCALEENFLNWFEHVYGSLYGKQPNVGCQPYRSIHLNSFVYSLCYGSSGGIIRGGIIRNLWASVGSWDGLCSRRYSPINKSTQSAVLGHLSLQYLQYFFAMCPRQPGFTICSALLATSNLSVYKITFYGLTDYTKSWICVWFKVRINFRKQRTVSTTFCRVCQALRMEKLASFLMIFTLRKFFGEKKWI